MFSNNIQKNDVSGASLSGPVEQAIILAGGLGTRLKETVPDIPKCIAPVSGRPFLFYVINYLRSQGIEKFIFSVGYKHEIITGYLNDYFSTLNYSIVTEKEPLGTGGAIKLALKKVTNQQVLVTNGDTLYKVNLMELMALHSSCESVCTLALKPLKDFNRYGVVETNSDFSVSGFSEKKNYSSGNINGGIYLINKNIFDGHSLPDKFSFENDYLEKTLNLPKGNKINIYGLVQDEYFIDIGIPEDYQKAQIDLTHPPLDLKSIDKSWTLFLDRDGVINHEKENDYIRNWQEFHFYDGVKEAVKLFTHKFGKIFIVTNQRGVERWFLSANDLTEIHKNMKKEIEDAGGRIDRIYFCTSIDNKHPYRKPNPGMAFRSKRDFPSLNLSKSIMIGNKLSDMKFGKNAGMYTVYLKTTHPEQELPHPDIDIASDELLDFAKACLTAGKAF